MSRASYLFTSESVSEGHPDKVCDQISDAVVDAYLAEEPEARCGVETLTTTNQIVLAGEVRGPEKVLKSLEGIARDVVKKIGYEQDGFHWKNAKVDVYVHGQSADIAQGVDAAGDVRRQVSRTGRASARRRGCRAAARGPARHR